MGTSGSLVGTIKAVRLTYQTEGGVDGLYRGFPMFLAHSGLREMLRYVADRCWKVLGFPYSSTATAGQERKAADTSTPAIQAKEAGTVYWMKFATKYLIDVACYPMLLTATRNIIMRKADPRTMQKRVSQWVDADGSLSLFNGLTAHLVSMGLDDIMDAILSLCIDRCSDGTELELADKLLLKTCGSSVVSVFTGAINHVGVIQRCQSLLDELVVFCPLSKILVGLPWKGTFYQFVMFTGIFALNVKLISMKNEAQQEDDEYFEEQRPQGAE